MHQAPAVTRVLHDVSLPAAPNNSSDRYTVPESSYLKDHLLHWSYSPSLVPVVLPSGQDRVKKYMISISRIYPMSLDEPRLQSRT